MASISGSKKGEGCSRRRKNWIARKRQGVEAKTLVEETKEVKRGDCGDSYLKLRRKKKVVMKEVWHHSQSLLRARADLNGTCVKPRFTFLAQSLIFTAVMV